MECFEHAVVHAVYTIVLLVTIQRLAKLNIYKKKYNYSLTLLYKTLNITCNYTFFFPSHFSFHYSFGWKFLKMKTLEK